MSHSRRTEGITTRIPLDLPEKQAADSRVADCTVGENGILPRRGMSRRRFLGLIGASAGALAVTGHRVLAAEPPKLKVGLLLPEKGPYAPESESLKAGFELYLKENKSAGQLVEIISQDPGSDETRTLEAVARLVMTDEVHFLVGPPDEESCERVNHAVSLKNTILFVTNPQVRFVSGELCFPGNFRVRPNTYQAARPLAPWAFTTLGHNGFFTGNDDAIGNELADFFAHGFDRSGGKFVDRFMANDSEEEIGKVLEAVEKLKPSFVYAAFHGPAAVSFLKAARNGKSRISCPIIGPEILTQFPATLSLLGKDAEGVRTLSSLKDPVGLVKRIESALGKKVSHASRAAEGFDIAGVVCQAAKNLPGDKFDPEKTIAVLEGITIDGAHGKLKFDKNHEPILPVMVQQWETAGRSVKRTIVASLGECASKDFGCGKVGFPKTGPVGSPDEEDPEITLEK